MAIPSGGGRRRGRAAGRVESRGDTEAECRETRVEPAAGQVTDDAAARPVVDLRKRDRLPTGLQRFARWWEQTFAGHTWRRARDVDVLTHIFALIAQLVLCAAPLLIAASAVLRRVGGDGLGPPLTHFLGLDRDAARTVNALFAASNRADFGDLVFGLVISALLGTGVAATQQRGYNLVWGLPLPRWHSIWRHVVWTVALAAYTAALLAASEWSTDVSTFPGAGLLLRCAVTLIGSVVFYAWSQHLLLGGRIGYRRLLPGALFIAVGVTVLVILSDIGLTALIHNQVTDYGLIGAAFILSIWLAVLSGLIFAGVLFGAVRDERRRGEPLQEPWLPRPSGTPDAVGRPDQPA